MRLTHVKEFASCTYTCAQMGLSGDFGRRRSSTYRSTQSTRCRYGTAINKAKCNEFGSVLTKCRNMVSESPCSASSPPDMPSCGVNRWFQLGSRNCSPSHVSAARFPFCTLARTSRSNSHPVNPGLLRRTASIFTSPLRMSRNKRSTISLRQAHDLSTRESAT